MRQVVNTIIPFGPYKAMTMWPWVFIRSDPFGECKKVEFNATLNHTSTYTDIMLYKKAAQNDILTLL